MYLVYSVYSDTVLSHFLIHSEYIRIHHEYTCKVADVFSIYGIQAIRHRIHQIHRFWNPFQIFSLKEKLKIFEKVSGAEIKFWWIASIACVSTLRHFSEKLYLLIQLRASIACVCTLSIFWKKSFTCKIAFWEIPRPFVLCWKKNKLTLLSKEKW